MVLGVDWLKQNSPVTFDYQSLSITILKEGRKIVLQGGMQEGTLKTMSGKGLSKLLRGKQAVTQGYLCMVSACKEEIDVKAPVQAPPEITKLLQQYEDIFQEPQGLPPRRYHDHRIPLKEDSQPVNQQSYRVPYFQKNEIER